MSPSAGTPNTLTRSGKSALAIAFTVLFAVLASLLFQAGPVGTAAADTVSDDPGSGVPEVEGPRVQIRNYARGGPQRLGEDREVGVARVRCLTGTCSVSEVVNARVKVRGQVFEPAEVIAPLIPLQEGEVGEVKVVVPETAIERLGGPRRVGMVALRVKASATLGEETVQKSRVVARGFKLARVAPQGGKGPKDAR